MTEPTLTPAEEKIAAAVANGLSCTRVAQTLDISKRTVYNHIMNIAGKLESAGLNPSDLKAYQLVSHWAFRRAERRKLSA
jgi:DNA-binding NarL/FixJ family response regulator